VSWTDASGRLWLFGGVGIIADGSGGELNDLWRYDPTSNEWTWVSGSDTLYQAGAYGTKGVAAPSNVPGARNVAVSWIDADGVLWLFGGSGYDSVGYYAGGLNDLWKFDPATLEWTWVAGSDTMGQWGTYGTKGTGDPIGTPGARVWPVSWVDPVGHLWLFGGDGTDSAGTQGLLNDLWKFDPATLQWTWVSGSDSANQAGTYGTRGTASPSNVPGARCLAVSWIDPSGNLWLCGGHGYYAAGQAGLLNDLWKLDPITLEWTWVSGSFTGDQAGIYGTKGVIDPSNVPGARNGAISWKDAQGDLWLFGGYGYYATGQGGYLNDLWRYAR
jgi:hypothetical protein